MNRRESICMTGWWFESTALLLLVKKPYLHKSHLAAASFTFSPDRLS
jgi:hypothetical protein